MKIKSRIKPYYKEIPKLLQFQFVSFVILAAATWIVSIACSYLLGLSGKVAITSGNLGYLFTTWQGYVIIALLILLVLCYIAIELNALIIYCNKLLDGKEASVFQSIKSGFISLKKYKGIRGILLILFVVFLAPILGLGFSISLTETFYIPNFITSVIISSPLLLTITTIVMLSLTIFAILNCFILHGALLDNLTLKEAGLASQKILKQNLRNFIPEMLSFIGIILLVIAILAIVFFGIPLAIVRLIPMDETVLIFFEIFFVSILRIIISFAMLMSISFLIIKLSILYKKYHDDKKWSYREKAKSHHPFVIALAITTIVACVSFSLYGATHFNEVFNTQITTEIVGHRAGGSDAPENTVKGIEVAYELGATGSEIDIQRTADGYYVINHDNDFSRVAGVNKTPAEMTLAEIKKLRIDGEPVPTLEEMLEAARNKVTLFVELKGSTADEQMADDAVRIIKEMNMQDQAVIISLNQGLIEYTENKYPEMLTGFLAFISLGQIENMPFDYLSLEEEISTDDVIAAIHNKGKKVTVWTVNKENDIRRFMNGNADAIVTDAISVSKEIKEQLPNRDPLEIIFQKIILSGV